MGKLLHSLPSVNDLTSAGHTLRPRSVRLGDSSAGLSFPQQWGAIFRSDEEMRSEGWKRIKEDILAKIIDPKLSMEGQWLEKQPWDWIISSSRYGCFGPRYWWWEKREKALSRQGPSISQLMPLPGVGLAPQHPPPRPDNRPQPQQYQGQPLLKATPKAPKGGKGAGKAGKNGKGGKGSKWGQRRKEMLDL